MLSRRSIATIAFTGCAIVSASAGSGIPEQDALVAAMQQGHCDPQLAAKYEGAMSKLQGLFKQAIAEATTSLQQSMLAPTDSGSAAITQSAIDVSKMIAQTILESRTDVGEVARGHGCKSIAVTAYSAILNDFKGQAYFGYQLNARSSLEKLK